MTTDLQILMARRIAEKISKLKGVASCNVDDWSDYGSFRLFAKLESNHAADPTPYTHFGSRYIQFSQNVNLRSLVQSINRILNIVSKESIVSPKRHYWKPRGGGRKECDGYEEDFIQIDFAVPEGITFQDIPKPMEVV